ncbi:MAG: tRNA-dihydrouridine synthase [Candidatus Pacebacteria bacterium]|nr:tRNA-dihydrouridine synthase [Candidatus Paceibacterota bacterium]
MKNNNEKIIMGFWEKLPNPFLVLAPMADVTDSAFRKIIAKYSRHGETNGGPHVFYTEFVSADGLDHEQGREKLIKDLRFSSHEHPIVAQIFSSNPDTVEKAARLCLSLGFDGVDINMGCPEKNICKQGAGSALIKNPKQAQEVIYAAKRGVDGKIPISVKTRVGWTENQIEEWIPALLECDIAAIILHGRTRKVMSKVPANWDWIARAGEIVRASGKTTKILGNGDVVSLDQAYRFAENYKLDGIMIGRGIFGNPWFFDHDKNTVSVKDKLEVLLEHTKLFLEELGDHKNFAIMKKHYKAYVSGFTDSKELRIALMDAHTLKEIEDICAAFQKEHPDILDEQIPC